jgi:hypothetical protein
MSEGFVMSTHNAAEPVPTSDRLEHVAEMIEFPTIGTPPIPLITPRPIAVSDDEPVSNAPSFYQRNSGSLPKSGAGMSDAHRRNQLPTPQNIERDTIGDKLRRFLSR